MTKDSAHYLLDQARSGADVSVSRITQALRVLGDIDPERATQVLCPCGEWEMTGAGLLRPAGVFDGLLH